MKNSFPSMVSSLQHSLAALIRSYHPTSTTTVAAGHSLVIMRNHHQPATAPSLVANLR